MAIKPSEAYVRFDEFEDVLASVELVALLAPFVREDPQYWKWIIVGAHSARCKVRWFAPMWTAVEHQS
jgi:hypothetical protein